jgi:hypothetical protein
MLSNAVHRFRLVTTLLVGSLLSPVAAQTLTQLTGAEGSYKESAGSVWVSAGRGPAVEGAEGSSRQLIPVDGKLVGSAEFLFTGVPPGSYSVQLAWPAEANALGAMVSLSRGNAMQLVSVDFNGTQAGTWQQVAQLIVPEESDLILKIDASTVTGPANPEQSLAIALDGARLVAAEADPFAAAEAGAATNTSDDPFAQPAAAVAVAPIAAGDPFSAAPADSPFSGSTAAAPAEDPFKAPDAPAAASADDPFKTAPTTSAAASPSDSPFSSSATTPADDPFKAPDAAAPATADPFQAAPTTASAAAPATDPFGSSTPDDPFTAPASAPAAGDSTPFAGGQVVSSEAAPAQSAFPVAAGDSPFSASSPTSSEPAADPFTSSGEVSSPFTAGGSTTIAPADSGVSSPFEGSGAAAPLPPAPAATPAPEVAAPAADGGNPFATDAPADSIPLTASPDQDRSILAQPAQAKQVELSYHPSIEAALAKASETNRPVFVLFTSNTASSQTFEDVLHSPEVADVLLKFERVRIDYARNRPIARRFSVRSAPYAVIINKHGFTEGHVIPSNRAEEISRGLQLYTQRLF